MARTHDDRLVTSAGKLIGKEQIYALLVDSDRNPVLDVAGNEQLVDLEVVAGRLQVDASRLSNAVSLQDGATEAGNGTPYTPASPATLTFEISGTSTSRTIYFELAGPKGVYVEHPAIKVGDTTYTSVTSTTSGDDTTPAGYETDIPAGYSFRARVGAVAGGDVDISGWAVGQ